MHGQSNRIISAIAIRACTTTKTQQFTLTGAYVFMSLSGVHKFHLVAPHIPHVIICCDVVSVDDIELICLTE